MLVIAHRGNHQGYPENSWAAFESAISVGADRIELDLQLSKDKKIYILHDDDLRHTTHTIGKISELTSQELDKITLKNHEPIPRLEEVLTRLLPRIELNLEIKGERPELAHLAAKQVELLSQKDKVIFSSFWVTPLEILRDSYPHLNRAVLWGEDTLSCAEPRFYAPQVFMQHIQTNIIHPQLDLITPEFMDQAKRHHWSVYVWACMKSMEDWKKITTWKYLRSLGVDGLCTNYPKEMREFVKGSEKK